jgi:hypothetical protein
MQTEIDVLRDVSRKFEQAGIAYMLTGSTAMNYYAEPRMTRDLDFVVALQASDWPKVKAVFEMDYYVPEAAAQSAIARRSVFNLIHFDSTIKVDCVVLKESDYRQAEFARRQQITVEDFALWIVSPEDLILSKLVWAKPSHSEMQLRDVRNLLTKERDDQYLNQWADALGLRELLDECRTATS